MKINIIIDFIESNIVKEIIKIADDEYQLYKLKKFEQIQKIYLPKELTKDIENIDYEKLFNNALSDQLKVFTTTLVTNFSRES